MVRRFPAALISVAQLALAADSVPFGGHFSYPSVVFASAHEGTSPLKLKTLGDTGMPYAYAHIAAILTFLVIPAAAIMSFLLTPFARRRRLLTWLLIPVIYVVVTYIGVAVAVNLGYLEL